LIEPVLDTWADQEQELAKASRLALSLLEQQTMVSNPPKKPQGISTPNRNILSTTEFKNLLKSKSKRPVPAIPIPNTTLAKTQRSPLLLLAMVE
jgi:hypothetical protein